MSAPKNADQPAPTYTTDPAQLVLTLPPGRRMLGAPKLVWKRWSPEEQFLIDMNDTIGSHSVGRLVEVTV